MKLKLNYEANEYINKELMNILIGNYLNENAILYMHYTNNNKYEKKFLKNIMGVLTEYCDDPDTDSGYFKCELFDNFKSLDFESNNIKYLQRYKKAGNHFYVDKIVQFFIQG